MKTRRLFALVVLVVAGVVVAVRWYLAAEQPAHAAPSSFEEATELSGSPPGPT